MKKYLLLTIVLLNVLSGFSQSLERYYIEHQNRTRTYLMYIPSTYDPESTEPASLVFVFHGIGATDENIVGVNMNEFAERDNFIVIYPQAEISEFGTPAWNCGTLLSQQIDDPGFFETLLDMAIDEFNIDEDRVYVSGFSMGGMMANRLACEFGDRIAACASVSGPMTVGTYNTCTPSRKMPYMHFHGTNDETVVYAGSSILGIKSVTSTLLRWASSNECQQDTAWVAVPDTADAWYHFDRLSYTSCEDNFEVIHYKIQHWPHAWPGPSRNVYATAEIADFFKRHTREFPEVETPTPVINETLPEWMQVGPNPFGNELHLSAYGHDIDQWQIYNAKGDLVLQGKHTGMVKTAGLSTGLYVLLIQSGEDYFVKKMIRE